VKFIDSVSTHSFHFSRLELVQEFSLLPLKEKRLALAYRLEFDATNNVAEYSALILGLELARKMGIKTLKVIGYSDLIVNQVKGVYWAKIID